MFTTATFDGFIGFCHDRCLNECLSDAADLPSVSPHRAVPVVPVLTYSPLSMAINLQPRLSFALNAELKLPPATCPAMIEPVFAPAWWN